MRTGEERGQHEQCSKLQDDSASQGSGMSWQVGCAVQVPSSKFQYQPNE
jgi:hypothetical protein